MPLIEPHEIIVISIAGPSGSGKSELCRLLAEHYKNESVVFSVDHYFKGRARMENDNFDHPSAIDWDLYEEHLHLLKAGEVVENSPIYDMALHGPRAETQKIYPNQIILTDGLLNLHTEKLRELADILVYVDASVLCKTEEPHLGEHLALQEKIKQMVGSDSICLQRRIKRDVVLRGRDEASVREQWPKVVECYLNYVEPSKHYAFFQVANRTHQLPGAHPNIREIIDRIEEIRVHRREQIPTVIRQEQFNLF